MIKNALISLFSFGLVVCANARTPMPPAASVAETAPAPIIDLSPAPFERAEFVRDTAARFNLDPAMIEATLNRAQFRDSIVSAMSRPAEQVKPWYEYRPIFITQARIDGGRLFLSRHRAKLERVQRETGVPAEVIVSIIGVETSYGANTGRYPVLDALYTLAFRYPRSGDPAKLEREIRRERFFRDELAQLFALANEEKLDIHQLTGSYAGAMGMGQFMPSSYRQFAVDGDGDGRRDLFGNLDDVFASIANYFLKKGGWAPGQPVVARADLMPGYQEFNPDDWQPTYTMMDLAVRGYYLIETAPASITATPISLEGRNGKQYWFGFQNYYAITRYNNSKMYAMAVHQLSQAIAGQAIPPA
ncbi:MAG: lytic murein transglycosylase B [Xanthomonadaceae bacterium]|jgi:membrane-bound lytic murein transglycosylase B|nr:lytic murein transglycosylase B [Xanthomonadaceae bacterium]